MLFLVGKINRYFRRKSASVLFRRPQRIRIQRPLISFSFDDFPRSALLSGGEILRRFSLLGTYYTALGLLDKDSPSGPGFVEEDLKKVLRDGHELGCHTFSHCDSWQTLPHAYEEEILDNRKALLKFAPSYQFRSFSYPISSPRPMSKRAAARHFLCCRGGGQTFNSGVADLNQLSAYFLEKAGGNIELVKALIDKNKEARGWLIFATHDVSAVPSPFGCTPEFFEEVVRHAVNSGAQILPVAAALDVVRGEDSSNQQEMRK